MNLLRQLASDVAANLRAKAFPLSHVEYAPLRFENAAANFLTSGLSGLALVFNRDKAAGDQISDARGVERNPRKRATMAVGCEAHVIARSPLDGARVEEHEDLCDQCVVQLVVELSKWCTAACAGTLRISEARYLTSSEVDGSEQLSGVIYRVRFTFERSISDQNFDGSALAVATFDTVARANIGGRISLDGENFEDIPNADTP